MSAARIEAQRRRWLTGRCLPVLALLALGVGCSEGPICTLVAMESGVAVNSDGSVVIDRFCLDDDCTSPAQSSVFVATSSDEPDTYGYELVVTLADGSQAEVTGEVTTEEFFVNGPDCAPKTANAVIAVDEAGAVTITGR